MGILDPAVLFQQIKLQFVKSLFLYNNTIEAIFVSRKIFRLKIPASTANLGPGFDTLGLALGIYNWFEIGYADNYKIDYADPNNAPPTGTEDLFMQAYRLACREINSKPKRFCARVINNIPLSRGLGSSGVAILGGVLTAFCLSNKKIEYNDVLRIALKTEKHPDNITPSLTGGFTISNILNNTVAFERFHVSRKLKSILVIPDFELRTEDARRALPGKLPLSDAVSNISRTGFIISAFAKGNFNNIYWAFEDKIHQPPRSKFIPGFRDVLEAGYSAGALGCFLSGAGPTIAALSLKNAESIGKNMCRKWKKHGVNAIFIVTGVDNGGAKVYL